MNLSHFCQFEIDRMKNHCIWIPFFIRNRNRIRHSFPIFWSMDLPCIILDQADPVFPELGPIQWHKFSGLNIKLISCGTKIWSQ